MRSSINGGNLNNLPSSHSHSLFIQFYSVIRMITKIFKERRKSHNSPVRRGFTLVELMTVIAIIAVLSTMFLSAVLNVKKRAQIAKCSSNLRQISMAIQMFLDDEDRVPRDLVQLNRFGYLPAPGALACPADKVGNWGGLVAEGPTYYASMDKPATAGPPGMPPSDSARVDSPLPRPVDFSYLHPFHMRQRTWDALIEYGKKDAGVVACQLHGIRRDSYSMPSVYAYSGLVLRGNASGSVVTRQIFWNQDDRTRIRPGSAFLEANLTPEDLDMSLWKFFSDSPIPTPSMIPKRTYWTQSAHTKFSAL